MSTSMLVFLCCNRQAPLPPLEYDVSLTDCGLLCTIACVLPNYMIHLEWDAVDMSSGSCARVCARAVATPQCLGTIPDAAAPPPPLPPPPSPPVTLVPPPVQLRQQRDIVVQRASGGGSRSGQVPVPARPAGHDP